jgi:hypothetical protein
MKSKALTFLDLWFSYGLTSNDKQYLYIKELKKRLVNTIYIGYIPLDEGKNNDIRTPCAALDATFKIIITV